MFSEKLKLLESFCMDMPFWNLSTAGWELPGGPYDWAVAVDLE